MGGRGQKSMGDGLFVGDDTDNSSTDYSRNANFDYGNRQYNPNGIRFDDYQEERRATAAISRFIADNKPEFGDIIEIPAETRKSGGSYSYTVKVTGRSPFDYIVIERVRII